MERMKKMHKKAELKLTTKAIRKILNDAGMQRPGDGKAPIMCGKICCGYSKTKTGMIIRNFIKDESIQVWAMTLHPVDDIRKAASLLSDAGYDVDMSGFQCLVRLKKD